MIRRILEQIRRRWVTIVILLASLFGCTLFLLWYPRRMIQINPNVSPETATPTATMTHTPIPTQTPTTTPTSTPTVTVTPEPTPNLGIGNTFDRNRNQPFDDPVADAIRVDVNCAEGKLRICIYFREPFPPEEYSRAVLVGVVKAGTKKGRVFQFQQHAGKDETGELVAPGNVQPFTNGRIFYDFERGVLCIEFDHPESFLKSLNVQPGNEIEIIIEVFHMNTPSSPWTGDVERAKLEVPECP